MPARLDGHLRGENREPVVEVAKCVLDAADRFEAALLLRGHQGRQVCARRGTHKKPAFDRMPVDPRVDFRAEGFEGFGFHHAHGERPDFPLQPLGGIDSDCLLTGERVFPPTFGEVGALLPGERPKLEHSGERVSVERGGTRLSSRPHLPLIRVVEHLELVARFDDVEDRRRHELSEARRVLVVEGPQLGDGHVLLRHIRHERRLRWSRTAADE